MPQTIAVSSCGFLTNRAATVLEANTSLRCYTVPWECAATKGMRSRVLSSAAELWGVGSMRGGGEPRDVG